MVLCLAKEKQPFQLQMSKQCDFKQILLLGLVLLLRNLNVVNFGHFLQWALKGVLRSSYEVEINGPYFAITVLMIELRMYCDRTRWDDF